jgi:hypothetical protein
LECDGCKRLQAEVDRLVEELADERERADALYVGYPPQGPLPAPAPVPPTAATALAAAPLEAPAPLPPPLRYRLVDGLNGAFKRYFSPAHRIAKRAIEVARK